MVAEAALDGRDRTKTNDAMTSHRQNRRRSASRWMGIWAAALCAMPAAAAAGPLDLYVERTAMTAADARCGLFGEELRAALQAKGYRLVDSPAQADFLVAYRVGVRDEEQVLLRDEGVGSAPTPQASMQKPIASVRADEPRSHRISGNTVK